MHMPFLPMDIFARAGGGGSGGGGGDGGGIFVIGYLAGHGTTALFKKFSAPIVAFIAGCVASAFVATLFMFWSPFIGILEFAAGVAGAYASYKGLLGRFSKNIKKSKATITRASQLDATWDETSIVTSAKQRFLQFQQDWQDMNVAQLKNYLTPDYYKHVVLMLAAMHQMGRKNTMEQITLQDCAIVDAVDDLDDSQDSVSVAFAAQMTDQLVDTTTGTTLNVDKEPFIETWHFRRQDTAWLIAGITPSTTDPSMLESGLRDFAKYNGMYFSPDWGRLLLPTRGQLFGGTTFKTADVNNHVIGVSNNIIMQLYTYGRQNQDFLMTYGYYMIGQINLPKSYGGIIVQRRDAKLNRRLKKPSKDYRQVSLEWNDFNKRYNVYATAPDQVTSFELLNPSFMAWLYDQDIKVSIEVVDNFVYLYAPLNGKTENRYNLMLEILQRSYKELKL